MDDPLPASAEGPHRGVGTERQCGNGLRWPRIAVFAATGPRTWRSPRVMPAAEIQFLHRGHPRYRLSEHTFWRHAYDSLR